MTKHPLTDKIAKELSSWHLDILDPYLADDHRSDMRVAADWQLEQVVKWLKSELGRAGYGHEIDVYDVLEDLKQAMRPQVSTMVEQQQQQQENS
jgi:hypothetical protein